MAFAARALGRTGKSVGPLGISASYGLGEDGVEMGYERGVRYFYWGSMRKASFGRGLKKVLKKDRDGSVLCIQTYTRIGMLMGISVRRALRWLDVDTCDVLLLGWWNVLPPPRILDAARRLRDAGVVKKIALSTHQRPLVPSLVASDIDVAHVRYNAVHRGAEKEIFPHLASKREERPGVVAFTATRWGHLLQRPKGLDASVPVPTAADCYRFCLTDDHVDCVATGPRSTQDLKEALDGLEKGPMNALELAWMRKVGDAVRAASTGLRDR